ncbi:gibberellin 2-beta-dioxygenase 5-like [Lolium rigidum]|uniref:gibberellin 2-beta-dioxygenase 5-like n=1 Tax=Lolium rigidum TaxID=89674 RepID=UPI001F5C542B|nr:gibberellin 2-beta-dioxygenase 5-like [Lolium rigidum]
MDDECNPPLMDTYKHLFDDDNHPRSLRGLEAADDDDHECGLPVIDLAVLEQGGDAVAAEQCRAKIVRAASEWGFFQVINHGVCQALLDSLRDEQVRVFRRPFQRKVGEPLLDFSPESYRWGTPTATSLEQLSWSEAYHIPMTPPSAAGHDDQVATADDEDENHIRYVIEEVSTAMSQLAQQLASILIRELQGNDDDDDGMTKCCTWSTCFLRLNRYPPCRGSGGAFGLCAHTDSDFLTILRPLDTVGGLQLLKDGRWLTVKPNPGALVVNIGDLLQAWSNDVYRSVEHRVVAHPARERFSVAFFLCPSYDTVIRPHRRPEGNQIDSLYRSFTFGEYRSQIREDVRLTGRKIGLPRFRRHASSPPVTQEL